MNINQHKIHLTCAEQHCIAAVNNLHYFRHHLLCRKLFLRCSRITDAANMHTVYLLNSIAIAL